MRSSTAVCRRLTRKDKDYSKEKQFIVQTCGTNRPRERQPNYATPKGKNPNFQEGVYRSVHYRLN